MTVNFGQAAINAVFAAMTSAALSTGVFDRVNAHEPENTPGRGLSCSIILDSISAAPAASGLAAVSLTVTMQARLWSSRLQRPLDHIDPDLLTAASVLCGTYAGEFTFGGLVRDVDVLAIRAQAGYIDDEGKPIRTVDVTVPVVINDAWTEAP